MSTKLDITKLPTVFRGVCWDDYWEFDRPCVVYMPYKTWGPGGSVGYLSTIIEEICIHIAVHGKEPSKKWNESELETFKHYEWSPRGFARRKDAYHYECVVEWFINEEDCIDSRVVSERTQRGPFND